MSLSIDTFKALSLKHTLELQEIQDFREPE